MLGLILMMAATGVTLSAAGVLWSHAVRRDREEELRFCLRSYRRAVLRYRVFYKRSPRNLEELIRPGKGHAPFLRRLYDDPTTDGAAFAPMRDPGTSAIAGARSANTDPGLGGVPYSEWWCNPELVVLQDRSR